MSRCASETRSNREVSCTWKSSLRWTATSLAPWTSSDYSPVSFGVAADTPTGIGREPSRIDVRSTADR